MSLALHFGEKEIADGSTFTIRCRAMASNIPYHADVDFESHERYGHFKLRLSVGKGIFLLRRQYHVDARQVLEQGHNHEEEGEEEDDNSLL